MIVKVARAGAKFFLGLAILVTVGFAKATIRHLIVARKIEIVLEKRGAGVGVVTNTIPSDPGVKQGKSPQKDKQQNPLESVLVGSGIRVSCQSASTTFKR